MPAQTAVFRGRNCLREDHDAGGRDSDGQAAGHPRPELGRREEAEPAVHQQVEQAVHGVDVPHQPPQLGH